MFWLRNKIIKFLVQALNLNYRPDLPFVMHDASQVAGFVARGSTTINHMGTRGWG